MSTNAASSPLSPTFSTTSTAASQSSRATFVSCLLVLPPSSSPASSPAITYNYGRRSSISAGAAGRGLFSGALAASTLVEDEPPSSVTSHDNSLAPETPTSQPSSAPAFGAPKPPRPFGAPAEDGSKKKRKSSRRPVTSGVVLEDKSLGVKRASVAAGAGQGEIASGLTGRSSSLGYVEGLKNVFKGMGIPVSTLRSPALISSHITPKLPPTPPSPSLPLSALPAAHGTPTTPSSTQNLTFLVLIPLNDHPSRPPPSYTAQLVLESGKTPSSICFDLDSEIRGKEAEGWEEERLEAALRTLSEVETKRREGDWKGVSVVVVAYSSNANLSDAVKRRCLDAGAELVLHPPYDHAHPGVPVAIQGALDAALQQHLAHANGPSDRPEDALPPMSAIRRKPRPMSPSSTPPAISSAMPATSSSIASSSIARLTSVAHLPSGNEPGPNAPRRASVDTGGVSLAFSRALERVDELALKSDMDEVSDRAKESESELELAELLMGMHLETQRAVSTSAPADDALLAPMTAEKRRELAGKLDTWGFEPHHLDDTDLFRCAQMMFQGALMCEGLWELDIPQSQIDAFILSVRQIYHAPNPYHNYIHATDVLQAAYTFLALAGVVPPFSLLAEIDSRPAESWKRAKGGLGRAGEVLRAEDVFALVVAAIGHDAAHPGLSNVFMKNAKTPLSQVYNDSSVLENMHCLLITTLLRKHGFTFLFQQPHPSDASATQLDWTGFRKILFSSIMATDMAMHFSWIGKLGQLGDKIAEGRCTMDEAEVWEDRIMICQAIIKCSDISNPTRPHDVSEHWSTVLLEEWTQQAFLESGLQLPVSVVKNADAALQAKGQVGFIDLFVQPLFNAVSIVIPQLDQFAGFCETNRALWSDRLASLVAEPGASVPIQPSKFSGPPLDVTNFSIPCSADSPYRSLFPYTMPGSLIAEIVGGSALPALPTSDAAGGSRSSATSSASVQSPLPPVSSSLASRPTLGSAKPSAYKQSFQSAYLHGVYDASARRKRESTTGPAVSAVSLAPPIRTDGVASKRPGHALKRSESFSSYASPR